MAKQVEQEVLDAQRAFSTSQALLAGEPLSGLPTEIGIGWHDTLTSSFAGAFALVGIESGYEDWVGEVLLVTANARACYVYVMGTADVPTPLSLARRAFCSLAALSTEELKALVQVVE